MSDDFNMSMRKFLKHGRRWTSQQPRRSDARERGYRRQDIRGQSVLTVWTGWTLNMSWTGKSQGSPKREASPWGCRYWRCLKTLNDPVSGKDNPSNWPPR